MSRLTGRGKGRDSRREPGRAVLVVGSGWSGTSWLAHCLVSGRELRLISDPLNRRHVRALDLAVRYGVYLDAEATSRQGRQLAQLLGETLDGSIHDPWIDRADLARSPEGRVIADIGSTNLLPWVTGHFPDVPVVYVLRHPAAVAWTFTHGGWDNPLGNLTSQHLLAASSTTSREVTRRQAFRINILRWCLENYVPVTTLAPGSVHVVFHEDLIDHRARELDRLAEYLQRFGEPWRSWRPPEQPPDRSLYPPATSRRVLAASDPGAVGRWAEVFDRAGTQYSMSDLMGPTTPTDHPLELVPSLVPDDYLTEALQVLERFGLDALYGPGARPLVEPSGVLGRGVDGTTRTAHHPDGDAGGDTVREGPEGEGPPLPAARPVVSRRPADRMVAKVRQEATRTRDRIGIALSPAVASVDLRRRTGRSAMLVGTGRSGSTWLGQIMAAGRHRVIFEPFNERPNRPFESCIPHGYYIDPELDDPELEVLARRIISGRSGDRFTSRFDDTRFSTARVVKDVASTNLLPWLSRRFPEVPIVYLLRHPIPVSWSWTELEWEDVLADFTRWRGLLTDYFLPHRDEIRRQSFLGNVVRWCLENHAPITQLTPGNIHVVFYEQMASNPDVEVERLAAYLHRFGEPWRSWTPEEAALARPSATDVRRRPDTERRSTDRVAKWREEVPDELMKEGLEILGAFGLDRVYDAGLYPKVTPDELLSEPPGGRSDGPSGECSGGRSGA